MPILETLGMQAASGAIGGALGLAFGGINDARQYKQQKRLQELQIHGNKELTDYNYSKQMQMWRDTNYEAQMNELRKAGLNPGLIYGMSGGGGTTTGSGGGGGVSGAEAPKGGREMQEMTTAAMGMGMQMQTLEIQKKLADIADKQAESEITKRASETQGINLSNSIRASGAENELKLLRANADKTVAEWYNLGVVEKIMSGLFPGQQREIEARIRNLDQNTAVGAQEITNLETEISKMHQDMRESTQRIRESYSRMALMKEEVYKLMEDQNLSRAQKEKVWQDTENAIKDGDIKELEKRAMGWEQSMRDEGWRHPVVQGILGIAEGLGQGWGVGKGLRMGQTPKREIRGFHNR